MRPQVTLTDLALAYGLAAGVFFILFCLGRLQLFCWMEEGQLGACFLEFNMCVVFIYGPLPTG